MILSNVDIGSGIGTGDGQSIRSGFNLVNQNFAIIQSNVNALTNSVTSVAGRTGNVVLTITDITGISAYASQANITTANTAMKSYVDNQIAILINSAPGALDTITELAAALGNDANFATTITSSLNALTANAGAQAGQLATLNSALVANVAALTSNAAVQAGIIANVDQTVTANRELATILFSAVNANVANLQNQVTALGDTSAITANLGSVSGSLATLTANAAVQAGLITSLTSNAGIQAGAISTLLANVGATSGTLATIDANLGSISGTLATLTANAAAQAGDFATIYANLGSISGTVVQLNANAAAQAGDFATIYANLGSISGSVVTLTANAAEQAGSIATITANLGAVAGSLANLRAADIGYANAIGQNEVDITALYANAGAQSGDIVTANTAMKSYVDNRITSNINQVLDSLNSVSVILTTLTANAASQAGQLASFTTYSNANVISYLPSYSGNINSLTVTNAFDVSSGNITTAGSRIISKVNSWSSVPGYVLGTANGNIGIPGNLVMGLTSTVPGLATSGGVNMIDLYGGSGQGTVPSLYLRAETSSTSATTGVLVAIGGVGIGGNLNVGNNLSVTGTINNINLAANLGATSGSLATLTANAGAQAGSLATITANLGATSGTLTTITANLGATSGTLATIDANLGAVSGSLATLTANAGVQAGIIAGLTSYANANAAAYLTTYTGNIAVVQATGNVTAQYLFGNGAFLTGVVTSGGAGGGTSYTDSNVATYLSTGTFNTPIVSTADITTTAYVNATGFTGNGALLTGVVATSFTGATNPSLYTGLVTASGSTTLIDSIPASGNASVNWTLTCQDNNNNRYRRLVINSLNDGANVYYNEYADIRSFSGALVAEFTSNIVSGNVNLYAVGDSNDVSVAFQRTILGTATTNTYMLSGAKGEPGNIANVITTAVNITNTSTSTSNVTGALTVTGGVGISGNIYQRSGQQLNIGTDLTANTFPAIASPMQIITNANSNNRVVVQNINSGSNASAGIAFATSTGTATQGFLDIGIMSTGANFGSLRSGDSFIFADYSDPAGIGGNLHIGAAKNIRMFATNNTDPWLDPVQVVEVFSSNLSFAVVSNTTSTSTTTGALTVTGGTGISGNLAYGGLLITNPNYITTIGSNTYSLSTTVTDNILLVASTGTVTVNMPANPVNGQVVTISANAAVTLAVGTGTVEPTFAGAYATTSAPFKYVYRTTGTTWYRIA